MKITAGEKTMSLEELASKICSSYNECVEGECPGFNDCHQGRNGVLIWLQKITKETIT